MKHCPQDWGGYAQGKAETSDFERGRGGAVILDTCQLPPGSLKNTQQQEIGNTLCWLVKTEPLQITLISFLMEEQ